MNQAWVTQLVKTTIAEDLISSLEPYSLTSPSDKNPCASSEQSQSIHSSTALLVYVREERAIFEVAIGKSTSDHISYLLNVGLIDECLWVGMYLYGLKMNMSPYLVRSIIESSLLDILEM